MPVCGHICTQVCQPIIKINLSQKHGIAELEQLAEESETYKLHSLKLL